MIHLLSTIICSISVVRWGWLNVNVYDVMLWEWSNDGVTRVVVVYLSFSWNHIYCDEYAICENEVGGKATIRYFDDSEKQYLFHNSGATYYVNYLGGFGVRDHKDVQTHTIWHEP